MWTFDSWSGDCAELNSGPNPLEGVLSLTSDKTCGVTFLDDPNVPNDGDANADGQKDSYQDNVVSLPDKATGQYVTTEVDKNCVIDTLSTDLVVEAMGYDPKYQFPLGIIYFDVACAKTQIRLYYHAVSKITRRFILQKYGFKVPGDPSTLGWYLFPNATFDTVTLGKKTAMRATYSLTDGELGDNTGVDGHIVDPVGVAVVK